ncbi:Zinc knuckle CX2CX4HX4C [Sesbania bispinosa]|nr:Zinc knuckle CX2CX4HX4C [Sesbania bispinosa]
MGRRIGSCMGEVRECEIFETKERGSFIKVQVDFDSRKPLIPRVNVGSCADGVLWVDFRYERLPQFCYACGLIGHEEDSCKTDQVQANHYEKEEHELGLWLRASVFGRWVTKFHKGDSPTAESGTQYKNNTCPRIF